MFFCRITHVAESGDDGSPYFDDIMLLKFLHVNKKALLTVLTGMWQASYHNYSHVSY